MNAQQLMERLFALAGQRIEDTVDTCKAGDPAKEVQKVALCCIASPSILRQAHAWGADLLITHEPTYHDNFDCLHADDLVATEKRRLVEATGMTIYRYHDHAHAALPDVIAMGELEELGWDKEEFDGQLLLTLHQPRPVRELAREIGERLGIAQVRLAGHPETTVKTAVLGFGARNMLELMNQQEADLYISGELCEWNACEYIRDAAELGHRKALLVLGHISSEKAGMKHAQKLVQRIAPGIETRYFDNPDVFTYIE